MRENASERLFPFGDISQSTSIEATARNGNEGPCKARLRSPFGSSPASHHQPRLASQGRWVCELGIVCEVLDGWTSLELAVLSRAFQASGPLAPAVTNIGKQKMDQVSKYVPSFLVADVGGASCCSRRGLVLVIEGTTLSRNYCLDR